MCDVRNAYLNAPCRENIWFIADPKYVPEKTGKMVVMVRDLYGSKSRRKYWGTMFAETLHDIYFMQAVSDPEVYHRRARKPNGE